jgi:hypothetical protein
MKIKLAILVLLIAISGCSTKQLYEQAQSTAQNDCKHEPNQDAKQECLDALNPDYRDYKRQRDELLKNDQY